MENHVIRTPVDTLNVLGAGGLKAGSIVMAYGQPGCFTGDTKVRMLEGGSRTLEDLSNENGHFWVYAYDIKNKKPVPGRARFASKHEAKDLVKITLDNGETLTCTLDHKWLKSNLEYCRADQLKPGDSIQAARFHKRGKYEGLTCTNNERIKTHIMVAYESEPDPWNCEKRLEVHHKDFNPLNNSPLNLELLSKSDHTKLHAKELSSQEEYRVKMSNSVKEFYNSERGKEVRNEHSRALKNYNKNVHPNLRKDITFEIVLEEAKRIDNLGEEFSTRKIAENLNCSGSKVFETIRKSGYPKISTFIEEHNLNPNRFSPKKVGENHKVKSIEFLKESIWVYDITVEDYHNFLIDLGDESGVFVHNSGKSTFSYQTAALYQKDNPDAVIHIVDSENSVDLNRLKHVFQLDMDRVKIHYTPTLEGAFKVQLDILAQMEKQQIGKYQDGRKQVKILNKKKINEMTDDELFKYCEQFSIPNPDGKKVPVLASKYGNDREKVIKALGLAGGYTIPEFDGPIPTLVIYDTIASSRPQAELDKIAEGNMAKNSAGMNVAAQVISTKLSAVLSSMGGKPFTLFLPNQVRNKADGFMGGFTEGFAGGWCLEHSCHYILKFTKINNRESRLKNYDDDNQIKTGTDFFMKIEKTKFCPATGRVDLYINDARGGLIIPREELAITALNLGLIKKVHGGYEIPNSEFPKMKWTSEEDSTNFISGNTEVRSFLLQEVTRHYRSSYITLNLAYKDAGLEEFGKPSEDDINEKLSLVDGAFLEESFKNPFA